MMTKLPSRLTGEMVRVVSGDPVWDLVEGKRTRFVRVIDSSSIELMTDDGNPLPGTRHPSQVLAY